MYAASSVVGSLGAQHLPLLLSQAQPDRQRMQSPTLECTPKGYSGRVARTLPKPARMQARVSGKSQEAKGPREMQGRAVCRSLGSLADRERGALQKQQFLTHGGQVAIRWQDQTNGGGRIWEGSLWQWLLQWCYLLLHFPLRTVYPAPHGS